MFLVSYLLVSITISITILLRVCVYRSRWQSSSARMYFHAWCNVCALDPIDGNFNVNMETSHMRYKLLIFTLMTNERDRPSSKQVCRK